MPRSPRLSLATTPPAHRAASSDSLGALAPWVALLAQLTDDSERLRRCMPWSADVAALERFRELVERTLAESRRADVWLTVRGVHAKTGQPISTITKVCRDHREEAGCYNPTGSWAIHWPTYEAWMKKHRAPRVNAPKVAA